MKSTKILLATIVLSLSLAATGCTSNNTNNKSSQSIQLESNNTNQYVQYGYNYADEDTLSSINNRETIPINIVERTAPNNSEIVKYPLPSEVTDSSFIPKNLLELSTQDLLKSFTDLGPRVNGSNSNANAGRFIKEYFEKSGIEAYKNGNYYDKFYAIQERPSNNDNSVTTTYDGYFENIIGRIKGKDSTKAIVLTAHFDTLPESKGVLDNGTGVTALLKLAKTLSTELKGKEFPVDIVFLATNSKEHSLLGVESALDFTLYDNYKSFYNLNMDSIGLKDTPLAYKSSISKSQPLYEAFAPYLDKHGVSRANDKEYYSYDLTDGSSFQYLGIASLTLGDDFQNGRTHESADETLDRIDTNKLDKIVEAVKDFIISDNGKIY